MKPPRLPRAYPDRRIDCQAIVEPRLRDILDECQAAGWSKAEIANAIIAAADKFMLAENPGIALGSTPFEVKDTDWVLPDSVAGVLRALSRE